MPRRQTDVLRNLDDPLKVLGVLTFRSCGLVFIVFAGSVGLDLVTGLLSVLPPKDLGLVWALSLTAGAAAGLAYAERHEDQHLVPSAIAYYASRPWRVIYSGATIERSHRVWVEEATRARAAEAGRVAPRGRA